MFLLKHEFISVVSRPLLWGGTLLFCAFLLHAVGHLAVGEGGITVAIYQTPIDSRETAKQLQQARALLMQLASINVLPPEMATTDIASQMVRDKADIAITQTPDSWRFTIKSRTVLEHTQFVRVAQELGESLSQRKPWGILVYESLQNPSPENDNNQAAHWPTKVQIAGITADPGKQARLFVPKTIALLAYFVAFAFASLGMIRDISNNMLPVIIVASRGNWARVIACKVLVSVMIGLITLWTLLLFAALTQDFAIKDGFLFSSTVQLLGLLISATLGIAVSLIARTEARIYFVGSAYIVLLVLLSGLIAKIEPKEKILTWISNVFPLAYTMDLLSNWMFFGLLPLGGDRQAIQILVTFLILSIIMTYASVLYFKRNI